MLIVRLDKAYLSFLWIGALDSSAFQMNCIRPMELKVRRNMIRYDNAMCADRVRGLSNVAWMLYECTRPKKRLGNYFRLAITVLHLLKFLNVRFYKRCLLQ